MRFLPLTFWHHATDVEGTTRFSLDRVEIDDESPRTADIPLESLRCDVIITLSNRLTQASINHPHLATSLMDALDNAIEALQLLTQKKDLQVIQQWLRQDQEAPKNKNRKLEKIR